MDYRTLYNVLRKRYDRTESTIANLENLKSRHENEIRNLQEKLQTKEIEHVTTQAQRDAAEKRADQLMGAIRDMSKNSPVDGPEQHEESPNQVLEDLRRKWNAEIKRLRDRIDTQNEQNRTLFVVSPSLDQLLTLFHLQVRA